MRGIWPSQPPRRNYYPAPVSINHEAEFPAIERLLTKREAIHRHCELLGWNCKQTRDESLELDRIDWTLTELGMFDTAQPDRRGGEGPV